MFTELTRRLALRESYLSTSLLALSDRVPFAGRANCPGFLPDEHIAACRLERTISRCCTHDRSPPSCSLRVGCLDSPAVGNTSELTLLRKCRDSVLPHDNATDRAFLRRCCLETS